MFLLEFKSVEDRGKRQEEAISIKGSLFKRGNQGKWGKYLDLNNNVGEWQ